MPVHSNNCFVGSVLLIAGLALSGCQDTLIFGERTGFNLAITVNNDAATPLNVNAGLERVVVGLVPPTKVDESDQGGSSASGEAVSMFSGFGLGYEESTGPFSGKLTIRTKFASGFAAREIAKDPTTAPEVVAAITNLRFVTPVSPALQGRRVAAADFVKTLTPTQQDQLAKDLGEMGGTDSLLQILNRISAAESNATFDKIAGSIRILFGQEV